MPSPPADGDIVAHQLPVLEDGDVTQILGINIHIVGRRHGEAGLEFTRQIGVAVEGLHLRLAPGDQLFIEPNLVIGPRLGQRVLGPSLGILVNLLQRGCLLGVDRGHDVAIHVAAGRDGIEQDPVHALDQGLHVAFEHTMKLEGLAGREPQRGRSQFGGELIQHQPLPRRGFATRQADPQHERVGLVLARFFEREPLIAVVLLVSAVKLDQLLAIGRHRRGGRIGELRLEVATQVLRSGLDALVGDERPGGRRIRNA